MKKKVSNKCNGHQDVFLKNLDQAITIAKEVEFLINNIFLLDPSPCQSQDETDRILRVIYNSEVDLKEILKLLMKLSKDEDFTYCEVFSDIVRAKVYIRYIIFQIDYFREYGYCDDQLGEEFFTLSFRLFSDIQATAIILLESVRATIL